MSKICKSCGKTIKFDSKCYACSWTSATEEVDSRFKVWCDSIKNKELVSSKELYSGHTQSNDAD